MSSCSLHSSPACKSPALVVCTATARADVVVACNHLITAAAAEHYFPIVVSLSPSPRLVLSHMPIRKMMAALFSSLACASYPQCAWRARLKTAAIISSSSNKTSQNADSV